MASNDPPQTEYFYTPWRLRQLLRDYAHLLSPPRHREEPEPFVGTRRFPKPTWGWLEDAVIRKADVDNALTSLPSFTRMIVFRAYVRGDTDKHLATILRCDRETVKRHRVDGLELMAWSLGWRGDIASWRNHGR